MKKVIISAAVTGAVHIPTMSEYLPITPDQIADEAIAAWKAGASVVHLHTRDPKTGQPNSDPEMMKSVIEKIKSETDLIIGCTTGGAIGMSTEERLRALPAANPDLASCNAGSINFCFSQIADKIEKPMFDWEIPFVKNTYKVTFSNTFEEIEENLDLMNQYNVKPEFEVYEVGMLNNIKYFMKQGKTNGKVYLQFILGVLGGMPATLENLAYLVHSAKEILGEDNFVWSCGAAGSREFDMATTAVLLGGNVRVGLEDNLYLKKGVLAKSNSELVGKMKTIVEDLDRQVATPDEAREILGITKK